MVRAIIVMGAIMYAEIQSTALESTIKDFPDATDPEKELVVLLASVPMHELIGQDSRFRQGNPDFDQRLFDMKSKYDAVLRACIRSAWHLLSEESLDFDYNWYSIHDDSVNEFDDEIQESAEDDVSEYVVESLAYEIEDPLEYVDDGPHPKQLSLMQFIEGE